MQKYQTNFNRNKTKNTKSTLIRTKQKYQINFNQNKAKIPNQLQSKQNNQPTTTKTKKQRSRFLRAG